MAELQLHGQLAALIGRPALVDDDDLPRVQGQRWWLQESNGGLYVWTWARDESGAILRPRRKVFLHRFLCPPGRKPTVDHRNGDSLDNRRSNLRPASYVEQWETRHMMFDQAYKEWLELEEARLGDQEDEIE